MSTLPGPHGSKKRKVRSASTSSIESAASTSAIESEASTSPIESAVISKAREFSHILCETRSRCEANKLLSYENARCRYVFGDPKHENTHIQRQTHGTGFSHNDVVCFANRIHVCTNHFSDLEMYYNLIRECRKNRMVLTRACYGKSGGIHIGLLFSLLFADITYKDNELTIKGRIRCELEGMNARRFTDNITESETASGAVEEKTISAEVARLKCASASLLNVHIRELEEALCMPTVYSYQVKNLWKYSPYAFAKNIIFDLFDSTLKQIATKLKYNVLEIEPYYTIYASYGKQMFSDGERFVQDHVNTLLEALLLERAVNIPILQALATGDNTLDPKLQICIPSTSRHPSSVLPVANARANAIHEKIKNVFESVRERVAFELHKLLELVILMTNEMFPDNEMLRDTAIELVMFAFITSFGPIPISFFDANIIERQPFSILTDMTSFVKYVAGLIAVTDEMRTSRTINLTNLAKTGSCKQMSLNQDLIVNRINSNNITLEEQNFVIGSAFTVVRYETTAAWKILESTKQCTEAKTILEKLYYRI